MTESSDLRFCPVVLSVGISAGHWQLSLCWAARWLRVPREMDIVHRGTNTNTCEISVCSWRSPFPPQTHLRTALLHLWVVTSLGVAYQIFTLWFVTVAEWPMLAKLWSSKGNNFMVGGSPQQEELIVLKSHSIRKVENYCPDLTWETH